MKILCLSHAQYITVALPKIIEQAEAIAGLGHEITLVCTSKTDRLKVRRFTRNGVHYITTPSWLWGKFRHGADLWDVLVRIVVLLNCESFDVIHAVDSRPTVILPALLLKKLRRIPLILEWSDLFGKRGTISERSGKFYALTFGKVESFFERAFRKYAENAIVVSNLLTKQLHAIGYPENRIYVQRYGCNTRNALHYEKSVARIKLKFPQDSVILIYVGLLFPSDLELLVKAARIAQEKYSGTLQWILIGNHHLSTDVCQELNFELPGRVSHEQLQWYFSASDLCLIPMRVSRANKARWPSKIADYLSAGRPTVATKVSDFEELFTRYHLGYLSESDSPQHFAEAVLSAIQDRENWARLGQTCKDFARSYLDVQKLAIDRIALYERTIQEYRKVA
ncbi:MAG: glycosyltransferase [bacterium]